MIEANVPSDQQARLTLAPLDAEGDAVTLDPNALTIEIVEGNGVFEYNAETNGLVFRLEDDATGNPVTRYMVTADGQPGAGVVNLPLEVVLTCVAPDPDAAVTLGEGLALETKGAAA